MSWSLVVFSGTFSNWSWRFPLSAWAFSRVPSYQVLMMVSSLIARIMLTSGSIVTNNFCAPKIEVDSILKGPISALSNISPRF